MLIIAYLSMFVDHVFKFAITANMQHNPIFGRIAMPIFMYMLAMGIKRTKSKGKYCMRLLVFAMISQIPYTLMITGISKLKFIEGADIFNKINTVIVFFTQNLNIGFELLFAALLIIIVSSKKIDKMDKIIMGALLILGAELLGSGIWHRLALAVMFYYIDIKDFKRITVAMILIVTSYILFKGVTVAPNAVYKTIELYSLEYWSIAALPIIYYYSKVKTKKPTKTMQLIKYSIYPLHLIIIDIVRVYLNLM